MGVVRIPLLLLGLILGGAMLACGTAAPAEEPGALPAQVMAGLPQEAEPEATPEPNTEPEATAEPVPEPTVCYNNGTWQGHPLADLCYPRGNLLNKAAHPTPTYPKIDSVGSYHEWAVVAEQMVAGTRPTPTPPEHHVRLAPGSDLQKFADWVNSIGYEPERGEPRHYEDWKKSVGLKAEISGPENDRFVLVRG